MPIGAFALLSSKIVKGAILKIYPGAPDGMCSTLKDRVNQELLTFIAGLERNQRVEPNSLHRPLNREPLHPDAINAVRG